jgi:PTH1 family peptidyl-tRNA hydrolase
LWLIAGLGNPGPRYEDTRHNAGFLVLGEISRRWGIPLRAGAGCERMGRGRRGEEEVVLLTPLSYMNRCGPVVARRALAEGAVPERVLAVVDDIELPLGRLRLRPHGSSGGHNGLASLIASLGGAFPLAPEDEPDGRHPGERFPRLRVGIGRPEGKDEVVDYVLAPFLEDERALLREVLAAAAGLVEEVVDGGKASSVTIDL